jgi:Glycoside hydrolase family 44/Bacterial Ig-like domain (group 3)
MRIHRAYAITLIFVTLIVTSDSQRAFSQTLTVDASASRHPISPDIYGIANYGLDATFAKEIQVGNIRWGGDGTTRYNWQVDSSNSGFDWYFMGGNGETTPVPSASVDLMVNTYKSADALITIPILPYVNKSAAWNCSFPVSVYGAQQSTNPYVHPNGDNCGNSIATNGTQLIDNNIYANHIDNTTSLQQQWVQHLVSTFGTAAKGGVKFYQLDNEPYGWSNTHRDVMPVQATYPTITQLGQEYAAAIKQADSTALVLGPSDFTLGGWIGNTSQQGGLYAGEYYLQQMAAYDNAHGQRILDYFDEHYYFVTSSPAAQLASTRTLWDPTYNGGTWVEQYDFKAPMQLIPRFRGWISANYPGTLLSLSEYSIDSGQKSIVDAIAEMDVLGIFGREPIDFASMWNAPGPQDPIAYSFRMFRNYDGNGSQFGDTSVSAVSSDQGSLSIYAAQRSSDNAVTILVINKTTGALSSSIAISNLNLPPTAQIYTYTQANLTSIAHPSDVAITGGSLSYTFPGYSAVMFVVQPAAASAIATTTTLSASATQINSGQPVTFNVTVAAAAGSAPSGTVTLLDGTTSIGTATLSNGAGNFNITTLAAGTHNLTANYTGDAADGSSTSNTVSVQVTSAGTLQATSVTLAASAATAVSGQPITLTAKVTPASATGTITFHDGSTTIGTATLTSAGTQLPISTLSVGAHSLSAAYSGDAADSSSTSNVVTVTITASPGPPQATSVTLAASAATAVSGQPITLTAKVAPASATGTITFNDGSTAIGTATLTSGGAQLPVSTLSAGTHSLSAAYGGDAADSSSTSNVLTVTITAPASPTGPSPDYGLTLSSSTLNISQATAGTLTVAIAPENGFNASLSFACSGLPSGWGCTFAPATLSGSAPESTTMTVGTNSSARLMPESNGLLLALVSPLPLFWFGIAGKSRVARWLALFTFTLALAGCGTSGNTAQQPQVRSSTYNVTVTATGASAPTHTQTFVLTMNQ